MNRFSRRIWYASTVVGIFLASVGVALALAPGLRINRVLGVAAVLPARDALTAVCAVLVLTAAALSFWRAPRPVTVPAGAGLLVALLACAPAMIARGLRDPAPAGAAAGQLRVLEWNTNGGLVSPAAIAALAVREKANMIVLPEAQIPDTDIGRTAAAYRRDFAAVGLPVTVFAAARPDAQAAVLMTGSLAARYGVAGTGPDPRKTLVLAATAPDLPDIVAVHAPQPGRRSTAAWRATLGWVAAECAHRSVLATGDFNASVDNFGGAGLGACRDAAVAQYAGSTGTWPTALPAALAMPIDHALTTPAAGKVLSFTVLSGEDGSGARHRPTLTVVRTPDET